ncbi:MAG: hypothetical protein GX175_03680 [Halanaerobiaceae bacterium]|jgi:hypothetical protein|nr:hypothetical protein [Halanaerobiaceae bacterium]
MIIEIIKDMARELRILLKSGFFWKMNIILLAIIILLFIFYLPFNSYYSIEPFLIGRLFIMTLIFGLSSICLYLTDGIRIDFGEERDSVAEYFIKTLSFVLIIIIIIFTYLPLAILAAATGSLSFRELYGYFPEILISGISFTWLGFSLKAWFRKSRRRKISAFLKIAWACTMILSSIINSRLDIMSISINICFIFSGFIFLILLFWISRKNKEDRS